MRLIDADSFYNVLNEMSRGKEPSDCGIINSCMDALDVQPTAYNTEKVVEQLTTLRDSFQKTDRSMWIGLNNAISIVKKAGGVDG